MMAQPFPAGMAPGHPAMGGHGHPMAGMQHPGGGHMGGPPGPGMMQGMHPGVSGPQVTQGPMVTGMPQGPGTPAPGPMHNGSMAMAHLGPQQHMFQQQNPQMAQFGQMQVNPQQQALIRHQMMQRMQQQQQQQQQQSGMPMGMQGNPNFNAQQQMAQMKMAGMPLQQQQQMQHPNYQHMQAQQQRIMQAHANQQAQAIAAQNQAQARQAQQMQLSRSQEQQTTQAPQPHPTPAPQNQPQPQPQPQPTPQQPQTSQPKQQPQPQPPTTQAPSQPAQQVKQNDSDDEPQIKQPDPGAVAMMQDIPKEQLLMGHSILQLIMFQDSLASAGRSGDLSYWEEIIRKYFAPYGSLKQQFINPKTHSDKSFQLHFPSLARFYHAHFGSGIRQILLQSYDHVQSRTASGATCVSSSNASLTYVFQNDIRVTTQGSLSVLFDESNKIMRFDLSAMDWQEYIPRSILLNPPSPDQKQSPKMNKNLKKVQQQGKQATPGPNIPSSGISDFGVPPRLIGFLEIAEVITQMQPLMEYYHTHAELGPRESLIRLNTEHQQNFAQANQARLQNQMARQVNGQIAFPNQGGPGMNGPNQFASPGMAHLGLPQGQGSPHIGGPVHTPSPAQNPGAGGVSMMHQMSAQGSNLSGSQGPSTNTSPNVSNKRRRPSAIKLEEENASQESNAGKVKPSPRIGGKRQKAG